MAQVPDGFQTMHPLMSIMCLSFASLWLVPVPGKVRTLKLGEFLSGFQADLYTLIKKLTIHRNCKR